MSTHLSKIVAIPAVCLVLFAASGLAPLPKESVLSVLKPGMPVSLTDSGSGYEIGIFTKGPDMLGYKVSEVGGDYLVLDDILGIKEVRIPIYAIKSVVTTKLPVGK
jgi:hypothetical protein